jgi:hypothetical protein
MRWLVIEKFFMQQEIHPFLRTSWWTLRYSQLDFAIPPWLTVKHIFFKWLHRFHALLFLFRPIVFIYLAGRSELGESLRKPPEGGRAKLVNPDILPPKLDWAIAPRTLLPNRRPVFFPSGEFANRPYFMRIIQMFPMISAYS